MMHEGALPYFTMEVAHQLNCLVFEVEELLFFGFCYAKLLVLPRSP